MALNGFGTRRLETERLVLRRAEERDISEMFGGFASKEECCKFFPWEPASDYEGYRERALSWIENYGNGLYFQWVTVLKNTGELIGMINLHEVNAEELSAETSYLLAPEHWGRGLMTEALSSMLKFAFEEAGFKEIRADVFSGNTASEKVLQKCGMSAVGIEKGKYVKGGAAVDAVIYSLRR